MWWYEEDFECIMKLTKINGARQATTQNTFFQKYIIIIYIFLFYSSHVSYKY